MEYLRGANTAKVKTELASYKEQVELFKIEQMSKDSNFLDESLTAGKNNLFYNTQKEEEQGKGTIKDVIENISDSYFEKMEIIKGELLINTKDNNEIKIAQSLGINVNPYDIDENGVLLSTGNNLALMDENGTVTIPDNVTEIGAGAFANEGLKTIIIPGTVKKIQANAFAYNSTLETVIMQEGVEEIGEEAFLACGKLKNITLPESLKKIGKKCFQLTNLSEVTVPSGIERIENATFANCNNLSKVILSEGLKVIGDFAFQYDNILEIIIPSTVETIGKSVFYNNMNLTKIEINKKDGKEANFIYEEGILMPKDKSEILFIANAYLKSTNEFEIPSGIKNFNISIMDFTNITKIIIPASLSSGLNAEYLPWSIESIEVKEGNSKYIVSDIDKILYTQDTKEIVSCYSKEKIINLKDNKLELLKTGNYSFRQAKNVETVTLPDSLEEIGPRTFTNCNNIKEINIGENVNKIDGLFKYKNYSGIVNISKKNNSYIVKDNSLYTKTEPKTLVVVLNQINGGFTIDSSVKVIGNVAFYEQKLMTNVIIPNSVITINNSFSGCIGLTSIEIPSNVESIGENCFADCSNLEKVTIYNKKLLETAPWGAVKGDKVIDFRG